MLEANAENVDAMETMVTMRVFCFDVKMLYGTAGAEETVRSSFSSSDIPFSIFTDEKESHLGDVVAKVRRLKYYVSEGGVGRSRVGIPARRIIIAPSGCDNRTSRRTTSNS
jgi:hypothetical protein